MQTAPVTFVVGRFLREGADVGGLTLNREKKNRGLLLKLKHLTVRTMALCKYLSRLSNKRVDRVKSPFGHFLQLYEVSSASLKSFVVVNGFCCYGRCSVNVT